MGQDRLNGLAMLYYHRDIEITSEEVVDEFSSKTDGIMTCFNKFLTNSLLLSASVIFFVYMYVTN